jgi:putative hemolysin
MLQTASSLHVALARSEADRRAAQALRYEVFVREMGGTGAGVDHGARLERDRFDAHADHLLLRDDARKGAVVGVYRLLREDQAIRTNGFYSATEFDVAKLENSGRRLLELGRSCLHPDYRGGAGMRALWQGVADYVARHQIDLLFGVASFAGTQLTPLQQPLSHLHHAHLAPPDLRVTSRAPERVELLPPERIDRKAAMRATPALIKAYLRLGGFIGEGVFVDHAFRTTDVCLILDTHRIPDTARTRFSPGGSA